MNNNSDNRNRIAFATAFIEAFLYWALLAGLASISIWSFAQTWQFTNNGQEVGLNLVGDISFWLAIVIQYSQNAFLFMSFVSKNKTYNVTDKIGINLRYIYMLGWIVTSLIDAGTNIGQWRADNMAVAATINIYSITWQLICAGCIFVEELFISVAGITLHKTNEFFVSLGFGGIDAFWLPDLINDKMKGYGFSGQNKNNFPGNTGQNHPTGESFNPSNKHTQRLKEQGNNKKKNWQPGNVGRPPKNMPASPLDKILKQDVIEER